MKRSMLLLILILAGCAPTGTVEGEGINRYADPDYGVVCYWRYSRDLSCVKVDR